MKIEKLYETSKDTEKRISLIEAGKRISKNEIYPSCSILLNSEKVFQTFKGFGGAVTESSGYVISKLPETVRQNIVASYFNSEKGNGYTIARTHMNSCDFSLENWACVPKKDETLNSFSMERTDCYITPLLKSADEESNHMLDILISPWSPPYWMKTNNDMNHGGKLLPQYKQLWANYFVKFIKELQKRNLTPTYVTVQNEPAAVQAWDSCEWSAEEEGEFATKYLGPSLEKSNFSKTKVLVWDHNRDLLLKRFTDSMKIKDADKYIAGAAYHWYSGDQYENVKTISNLYPEKELFFTEGCVEGGPRNGAWFTGERYAHNIINDLNNGCTAWIDWNILLDMQGGPNHVGNFCDSPVLADLKTGNVFYQSSYYYIGHFSRFIKPGAKRVQLTIEPYLVPAAVDGKMGNTMEATAFKNIDGTIALVVVNRTEADMNYILKTNESEQILFCPPRSIQTLILKEE
ncbi:MAG: glycoside hydrolase family 30 protein [Treponema sp.]